MLESAEMTAIVVDGALVAAPRGANLAAVLLGRASGATRVSVQGALRGPLCGMGVCFECRVTVDGRPHVRACMTVCRPGLAVETGLGAGSDIGGGA